MKTFCNVCLFLCALILPFRGSGFAAEAKPGWQTTWEKTIEAAKKEGRLNFYVGRYGSEPMLNEFRKEFPWLKLVTVNGSGISRRMVGSRKSSAASISTPRPAITRASISGSRWR